MALEAEIIVKCPSCKAKFKAYREEEPVVVPCPECDLQIKLSSLHEARKKTMAQLPRIRQLPERQTETGKITFQDLARPSVPAPTVAPRDRKPSTRRRKNQRSSSDNKPRKEVEVRPDWEAPETKPASSSGSRGRRRERVTSESDRELPVSEKSYDQLKDDAKNWKVKKIDRDTGPNWESQERSTQKPSYVTTKQKRSKLLKIIALFVFLIVPIGFVVSQVIKKWSKPELKKVESYRPEETLVQRYYRAKPFLEKFVQAESIDEMIPFIRDKERVEPMIRDYYKKIRFRQKKLFRIGMPEECVQDSDYLVIPLRIKGETFDRAIAVSWRGPLKFDWESYEGYSDLTIKEFRKQKPLKPVLLRVELKKDAYFNRCFSDPDRYECYEVNDVRRDWMHGYIEKDSDAMFSLKKALAGRDYADEAFFAIIRGKFPKLHGNHDRQFEIAEIVSIGWVLPNEPEDSSDPNDS